MIARGRAADRRGDPADARHQPQRRAAARAHREVVELEGAADDVHAAGLKQAFQEYSDEPMQFIVAREIYKHLERITDAFEDVANEIDGIVIDHA